MQKLIISNTEQIFETIKDIEAGNLPEDVPIRFDDGPRFELTIRG